MVRFVCVLLIAIAIAWFTIGNDHKKAAVVLDAVDKGIASLTDKPEPLDAPPSDAPTITATIFAELQPLQLEQSADLEFHLRDGELRPETLVATVKLQQNRDEPTKEVKVILKAGYAYRYKISARTKLFISKQTILGTGSNTGTITVTEAEKLVRLVADTGSNRIQGDKPGEFAIQYRPFLELISSTAKKSDPVGGVTAADGGKGEVVFHTLQPLKKDVSAWIEVDGQRRADWPNESLEASVSVAAGKHRLVVRSIYAGKAYKKEFAIVVVAGGVEKLTVGTMDPSNQLVSELKEEAVNTKPDSFAIDLAKYENDAANRMNLIRPLARDPYKKQFAIEQLQKLIKAFPDAGATKEAQTLLIQLQE